MSEKRIEIITLVSSDCEHDHEGLATENENMLVEQQTAGETATATELKSEPNTDFETPLVGVPIEEPRAAEVTRSTPDDGESMAAKKVRTKVAWRISPSANSTWMPSTCCR